MPRVWVSVGSNIDRERHIRGALVDLHSVFGDLTVSPLYETEAVGFEGDAFYNLVVGFDTAKTPGALHRSMREIEARHGRERSGEKSASRTLDLDLLFWGEVRLDHPRLVLPHPRLHLRAFVLEPLLQAMQGAAPPRSSDRPGSEAPGRGC